MDQDDPEQRIAELERQWADAQAAAATDHDAEHPGAPTSAAEITQRPPLTPADIKKVAFSRPPMGKRGYNEDEVDAFLDRVESEFSRLDGTGGRLDAGQQYQPQTQPVAADDGSTQGRSRRSIGIGGWLTTIVVAGIWLYMFGDLVWDVYGYQVGTPATATDVRCRGDADTANARCSGNWSVGGQSRNGPIHRVPENWKFGQPLDVHAHGGTAFAAGSTGWRLAATILVFLVVIAMSLGGFRALDRRWRRWRTRR
jgi:DivIVA domain-containing protein